MGTSPGTPERDTTRSHSLSYTMPLYGSNTVVGRPISDRRRLRLVHALDRRRDSQGAAHRGGFLQRAASRDLLVERFVAQGVLWLGRRPSFQVDPEAPCVGVVSSLHFAARDFGRNPKRHMDAAIRGDQAQNPALQMPAQY